MPESKYLVVVSGPTASGKTAFAIQLAQLYDTVILSCDSRQFYREMNIGTAKPTAEERSRARHYFVDSLSITDDYSIGDFARDAEALLRELFEKKDVVVLCGGSGMYLKALCEGLDDFPEVPPAFKTELNNWYRKHGLQALRSELQRLDPDYFDAVDQSNPHRLLRALAVCKVSGKPFSGFLDRRKPPRPFQCIYLWMHRPRPLLYERINNRVDAMIGAGQIEEARTLYPQRHLTPLQTVGYQELFTYFDGDTTREEAIELIKRNSRRYAKRQVTWSRRDAFWKQLSPEAGGFNRNFVEFALQNRVRFKASPLPGKESLSSGQFLSVLSGNTVLASVEIRMERKYSFLKGITAAGSGGPAERYLWHEAILRCDPKTPIFSVPATLPPPLPEGFGSKPARPENLPEGIRKTLSPAGSAVIITGEALNHFDH